MITFTILNHYYIIITHYNIGYYNVLLQIHRYLLLHHCYCPYYKINRSLLQMGNHVIIM